VLESPLAALYLRDSSINGDSPDKPNVDFTMSLAFRPPTKGRTYAVER
jgi:hypothetical protein